MYIAAALLALRSEAAGDIAHLRNKQGLTFSFRPHHAKVWWAKPI